MMNETVTNPDRPKDAKEQDARVRLRLWPAIAIVCLQILASGVVYVTNATSAGTIIGMVAVPLAAGLLLFIWWLAFSRAPFWDRIVGSLLLLAACGVIVYAQKNPDIFLMLSVPISFSLPAIMIGATMLFAATTWLRWPLRRYLVVAYLAAVVGVSILLRVDGFTGSVAPVLRWCWTPSAAEPQVGLKRIEAHAKANLPPQLIAGDWPGFRGEKRDGRLFGVQFKTDWSTPPRELWRKKIGNGWSSFAAIGDYVFTQEQRGKNELVTCYRADTGEDVWANEIEDEFTENNGAGPRATPTYDRGRLYTQGATGILQCLDAATGATLWQKDLKKELGVPQLYFGFSSSPLVVGERCYVFTGGGDGKNVASFECASGAVVWTSGWNSAGYSSPQLSRIAGVPQILMVSDAGIQSFDLDSGNVLWDHVWKLKVDNRIVQPLVIDIQEQRVPEEAQSGDGVLVGTSGVMGTRLLRIKKTDQAWAAEEVYTARKFRPYFNDFVLHKKYCYGFDGTKLACMDPGNGKVLWASGRCGGQLLLVADMDALLVLNEAGDVLVVRATPEAYTELGRFNAIEGKTWNHPVIAHGRLFVRNAEEAVCYELGSSS